MDCEREKAKWKLSSRDNTAEKLRLCRGKPDSAVSYGNCLLAVAAKCLCPEREKLINAGRK